jgi:hypothetical protein
VQIHGASEFESVAIPYCGVEPAQVETD